MLTAARIQRRWQRLVARCSRVQGGRAPRECRGAARGALRRGSEGRSRRMERSPGAEAAETILGREGRTGSLEGFAALGRMQGARAQATVCGARAAAARGVQALDHEEPSSGGWGGAAVRRVHGAAVTWSPLPGVAVTLPAAVAQVFPLQRSRAITGAGFAASLPAEYAGVWT